jgi:hypothetical protein
MTRIQGLWAVGSICGSLLLPASGLATSMPELDEESLSRPQAAAGGSLSPGCAPLFRDGPAIDFESWANGSGECLDLTDAASLSLLGEEQGAEPSKEQLAGEAGRE